MNYNDIADPIEEGQETEDISVTNFLSNFKRKAKTHNSLFENSFTQRLNTTSQVNFSDHSSNKFMEY